MLVDSSLVLYIGLFILFMFRLLCPWHCCGIWMDRMNYVVLLHVLVALILVYEVFLFIIAFAKSWSAKPFPEADLSSVFWLEVGVWLSPFLVVSTCVVAWNQTMQHIEHIRRGTADFRHGIAAEILALPCVYGVMSFSGLVRIYQLCVHQQEEDQVWSTLQQDAFSKYDTVFYVADLYEAWTLCQFGRLVVDLITDVIDRKQASEVEVQQVAAKALARTHGAMASTMGLGTSTFVFVCILQAGCAMWLWSPWAFADPNSTADYEALAGQFYMAGFATSCIAIFNVHNMEHTFDEELEGFRPLLKFLSVKILVTIAFMQSGVLLAMQKTGIMPVTDLELYIVNAVAICFECLFIAMVHLLAWDSDEPWYQDGTSGEREALLQKTEQLEAGAAVKAGGGSTCPQS